MIAQADWFAGWYRLANPDPDPATVERRWNAARQAAVEASSSDILGLARLSFGRAAPGGDPPQAVNARALIARQDETLGGGQIDLEMAILAAAGLMSLFAETSERADLAAIAVQCGAFAWGEPAVGALRAGAATYIEAESVRSRQAPADVDVPDLSTFETTSATLLESLSGGSVDVPALAAFIKESTSAIAGLSSFTSVRTTDAIHVATASSEESNVMWWLAGGISSQLGCRWHDATPETVAMVAGAELASLTMFMPGLRAAKQILSAVFVQNGVPDSSVEVRRAVQAVPPEIRRSWLEHFDQTQLQSSPVLFATAKSLDVTPGDDWTPPVRHLMDFDPASQFNGRDLAVQVYFESLLPRACAAV